MALCNFLLRQQSCTVPWGFGGCAEASPQHRNYYMYVLIIYLIFYFIIYISFYRHYPRFRLHRLMVNDGILLKIFKILNFSYCVFFVFEIYFLYLQRFKFNSYAKIT